MMSALVEDPAARDARVDTLLDAEDRRKLEAAIEGTAMVARLLRRGNTDPDLLADVLDWAERDTKAVLDRMNAREARR